MVTIDLGTSIPWRNASRWSTSKRSFIFSFNNNLSVIGHNSCSPDGQSRQQNKTTNQVGCQPPNAPIVPSQNENKKRAVQERNAPVFAPVFTALRRGELLPRDKECGVRPNLIAAFQSARGLAHSKTLRAIRESSAFAPASWTAVALHRFSPAAPRDPCSSVSIRG